MSILTTCNSINNNTFAPVKYTVNLICIYGYTVVPGLVIKKDELFRDDLFW